MDEISLEDIPIEIEGVNLQSVPSSSNEPLVEENLSDIEGCDSDDNADEGGENSTRTSNRKDVYTSKLSPHIKGLMGEANLRYARGDIETAKKMCFEIIREAPEAYEPYFTLSQMYETTNLKKYKGYLMLANHLAPYKEAIAVRLAELHLQEGDCNAAIKCYSRALKSGRNNVQLHERRLELLQKGGYHKLLLTAKQTMAKHLPKRMHEKIIQLAMEVASELFSQKNYARAVEALKIPINKIPEKVTKDVINMMLELLLISERYSECLDIFTQFCGLSFVVSLTETNNIIVNSYVFPENLEVDLKMKFIICLIKLHADHLFPELIDKVILEYDAEVLGDLYLDTAEALMQSGYHFQALKLLVPLVKSNNYSLAAVWLKYAECLVACDMPEQAIDAYYTVKRMAPSHVEVLYPLAMLLIGQNKKDEALEVMSQDRSSNRLDVAVLIEQMKLLKQMDDWESYWNAVELLLSRHCMLFRNRREVMVATGKYNTRKYKALQVIRNALGEDCDSPQVYESLREPSVEDEYKLFRQILQEAMDRKEYAKMEKFAYMGMSSKKFLKYYDDIHPVAIYASYFNHNYSVMFRMIREDILTFPDHSLSWNLLNLPALTSEDYRIRLLRFLSRNPNVTSKYRDLIQANYDATSGSPGNAINYFTRQYKTAKSPYNAFMLGITILYFYNLRFSDQKKVLAETITYLFHSYAKLRSGKVEHEIFYNLGRMYHYLGVMYMAEHYYKKVLKVQNRLLDEYPEILGLKQEAAYNLHLIYKNSGNYSAARKVLWENIVI